jgi:myo-inositol 2-dehydrogenase/D-chiro-inositol 1-dehydrogenase
MLEIAVLGAGRIGRIHTGNIAVHPDVRLAGIADTVADAVFEASSTGRTVRPSEI